MIYLPVQKIMKFKAVNIEKHHRQADNQRPVQQAEQAEIVDAA